MKKNANQVSFNPRNMPNRGPVGGDETFVTVDDVLHKFPKSKNKKGSNKTFLEAVPGTYGTGKNGTKVNKNNRNLLLKFINQQAKIINDDPNFL
jgi:hypothetical protein